jgi:DHA1 family bicyclomycin/chloramphenicol resistance-like MFS transporter
MSNNKFALIMAMVMAVSPLAIDAYLPAIPNMAEFFSIGTDKIATTISFYILGLSAGQLIGGPLADRYGKRTLILCGLFVFAVCSFIIAQTTSFITVQICRTLQAIGGGFSMVCIAPLIRERAKDNDAARLFALIGLIMVAAPAIAPSIGAFLIYLFSWQSIFYLLSMYALIVMFIASFNLPSQSKLTKHHISAYQRYKLVIHNRPAMRYLFAQSCSFSVMMIFITNSSFIYQEYFAMSNKSFALMLGANIVMMVIFNRYNNRRLAFYPAQTLLRQGLLIQISALFTLLIFVTINAPVEFIAIGIIVTIGAQGAISPNSNATYISLFQDNTGSASALMGASQFLLAATISGISTWLYNGTLWPVVIIMFSLSVCANALLYFKPSSKTMKSDASITDQTNNH